MRTIAALLFAAIVPLAAQDILQQARALVTQKQPTAAITLLENHLAQNPGDLDAQVLHGLILSWEARYPEGRAALEAVLLAEPRYKDARMGLINLERWSGQPSRASSLALQGLELHPKDPELQALLKKALQEERQAKRRRPGNLETTASGTPRWEFGIDANRIGFSDGRPAWNEHTFILSKGTAYGLLTTRLQQVRFGSIGSQLLELEMYPTLGKGRYGLISGGFSPDHRLYARRRFATEIFQSLPRGWEASGGYRYFNFGSTTQLVTGSVAKYFGDWWISGRTFVSPTSTGTSQSFQFAARRYFGDADHFIGLRGGFGASPFEVRSVNETGFLDSETIGAEALWKFPNRIRMRINAGVSQQERSFTRQYLWLYTAGFTLYYGL